MLVYFDTEFTHLGEGRKLISVGFVADDGQELYIELPGNYTIAECGAFTVQHVLPHLDPKRYGLTHAAAAQGICQWIERLGQQVELATDAPGLDFTLVAELLHSWPPLNLMPAPRYIALGNVQEEYEAYFERPGARRHHALWDARALAHAARLEDQYWEKCHG
jgi:hypothetical protein